MFFAWWEKFGRVIGAFPLAAEIFLGSDRRRPAGPNFQPVGPEPFVQSCHICPPPTPFVNPPHGKKENDAPAHADRLAPRLPVIAPSRCAAALSACRLLPRDRPASPLSALSSSGAAPPTRRAMRPLALQQKSHRPFAAPSIPTSGHRRWQPPVAALPKSSSGMAVVAKP